MFLRKTIALTLLIGLLVLTGPAGNLPGVVQAAPLASLPASDSFGYVPTSTTRFTLPADVCSTGTILFQGSDTESFSAFINPAGFSFPFYEKTVTNLRVSVNGLITVTDPNADVPAPLPLPSDVLPNGLIAPYWTDLNLAGGKVCYRQFTTEGYLAIEWNSVQTQNGTPITFQALLYPNGNIIFQYPDPIPTAAGVSIGIEDAEGIFGMQLHDDVTGTLPDQAILITFPAGNHAGARFIPAYSSGFLIQHEALLKITLQNITSINTAFQLDLNHEAAGCGWALPAGWTVTFLNGNTPLAISGGCPLTSSVTAGATITLTARILSPASLVVGDFEQFTLTALPTATTALPVSMRLQVSVPANFAQAYKDSTQSINLNQTWKDKTTTSIAGDLLYYGANLATIQTTGGNYFIVWEYKFDKSQLKGSFLGRDGSQINKDFMITTQMVYDDEFPALAALPGGSSSVVWIRNDAALYMRNYSASGAPLSAEKSLKITGCPRLSAPQVAAVSNTRLFVVWECDQANRDIYLNVVDIANGQVIGDQLRKVTQSDTQYDYYNPQALVLDNGTVMVSYIRNQKITGTIDPLYYQVLDANGTAVQLETGLDESAAIQAPAFLSSSAAIQAQALTRDTAQLHPGIVLAGWTNTVTGSVQYSILRRTTGNTWAPDPVADIPIDFQVGAEKLSITNDPIGNGVFTWLEGKKNSSLNYALVGPDGGGNYQLLTPAMAFFTGSNSVTLDTSATGQGNTLYDPRSFIYLPLIKR